MKFNPTRFLPFLAWRSLITPATIRADFVAGLSVALVLIPQGMANAQLAGLPAYYGLYAGFIPCLIAALFGSSRQLSTGPVALVCIMTAATLEPIAAAATETYIAYVIMVTMMVGIVQLLVGVLRLGLLVNFLSHPVIVGFTSAAAIIIATSQLRHLFGIEVAKQEYYFLTVLDTIREGVARFHPATLMLGLLTIAIMLIVRRINRRIPAVLIAVAIVTTLSWAIRLEFNARSSIDAIQAPHVVDLIHEYNAQLERLGEQRETRTELNDRIQQLPDNGEKTERQRIRLNNNLRLLNLEIEEGKEEAERLRLRLLSVNLSGIGPEEEPTAYYPPEDVPEGAEPNRGRWRIIAGSDPIDTQSILLRGGGDVVGDIPDEVFTFEVPTINWRIFNQLLGSVLVISLLSFMEAISIAKAMASQTGQRIDPNQELIGQGLANFIGSFFQSCPVSGSFARSAVNFSSGARTGMSSVFTSLLVLLTLAFLSPLLYHVPKAALAGVVIATVLKLVSFSHFRQAWRARRSNGVVAALTFAATLILAPELELGVFIGVGLSLTLHLYGRMFPQVGLLSLHSDGVFRDAERFGLEQCRHIGVLRFYGSLFYANVNHFEQKILDLISEKPQLQHIIIVGEAVNDLDATGVESLENQIERLRAAGIGISFCAFRSRILTTMTRTGVIDKLGSENLYHDLGEALDAVHQSVHANSSEDPCPLRRFVPLPGEQRPPTVEEDEWNGVPPQTGDPEERR